MIELKPGNVVTILVPLKLHLIHTCLILGRVSVYSLLCILCGALFMFSGGYMHTFIHTHMHTYIVRIDVNLFGDALLAT